MKIKKKHFNAANNLFIYLFINWTKLRNTNRGRYLDRHHILVIKPTRCTNSSNLFFAVRKPVWHRPLLCVQWKTPDNGQRNCPKHVDFFSKNKFEKLVHLFGFIIRVYHDARSPERQTLHMFLYIKIHYSKDWYYGTQVLQNNVQQQFKRDKQFKKKYGTLTPIQRLLHTEIKLKQFVFNFWEVLRENQNVIEEEIEFLLKFELRVRWYKKRNYYIRFK